MLKEEKKRSRNPKALEGIGDQKTGDIESRKGLAGGFKKKEEMKGGEFLGMRSTKG